MRHFQQIAAGIDTLPILNALKVNADLWDQNTLRTTHPGTPHGAVSDIWLMFNDLDPEAVAKAIDDKDVIPYPAWYRLPQVRPIIFDLMRRVEATRLGRCLISRLDPGDEITPHVDGGAPATWYTRYQIALQSLPGCIFKAGNEQVTMKTGDVWHFDNQQEHAVINHSADQRIAMIVDLRID